MTFETLVYEKRDGTAILTLNRPDRLNALNSTMSRELPEAWADIKRDPDVRAVVVTGAGDRALCSGYDMGEVATSDGGPPESIRFTAIHNECWKPVITAVNGMVCGGGLHFVADSDILICAEHATFFDTHVNVGLVAGMEPIGLARRIALEPVLRMALVGRNDRMDAERARQLGLVSEVLPADELLPRAIELARLVGENSPEAIAESKRAIWQSLDH